MLRAGGERVRVRRSPGPVVAPVAADMTVTDSCHTWKGTLSEGSTGEVVRQLLIRALADGGGAQPRAGQVR